MTWTGRSSDDPNVIISIRRASFLNGTMTPFTAPEGAYATDALMRFVQEFASARDWEQFHDPKNLAMALASQVGELVSILRWIRGDESDSFVAAGEHRDELKAEIGDIGICVLLLCARAEIDLGTAVTKKLSTNAAEYPLALSRGRAEPPSPVGY